jgi:hypothetical protein
VCKTEDEETFLRAFLSFGKIVDPLLQLPKYTHFPPRQYPDLQTTNFFPHVRTWYRRGTVTFCPIFPWPPRGKVGGLQHQKQLLKTFEAE